ncbi:MAG: hypothetical protein K2L79_01255, partial [Bacteroidales bacterium]|nr:hypothetical protein [Bacteroidales bacterium]
MKRQYIYIILLLILTVGCRHEAPAPRDTTSALPSPVEGLIFPDYGDSIVLPPNIAPLNFSVNENIRLRVSCG